MVCAYDVYIGTPAPVYNESTENSEGYTGPATEKAREAVQLILQVPFSTPLCF